MVSGRSLVDDAVSGAKIAVAPCHLTLAVAGLPLPVPILREQKNQVLLVPIPGVLKVL